MNKTGTNQSTTCVCEEVVEPLSHGTERLPHVIPGTTGFNPHNALHAWRMWLPHVFLALFLIGLMVTSYIIRARGRNMYKDQYYFLKLFKKNTVQPNRVPSIPHRMSMIYEKTVVNHALADYWRSQLIKRGEFEEKMKLKSQKYRNMVANQRLYRLNEILDYLDLTVKKGPGEWDYVHTRRFAATADSTFDLEHLLKLHNSALNATEPCEEEDIDNDEIPFERPRMTFTQCQGNYSSRADTKPTPAPENLADVEAGTSDTPSSRFLEVPSFDDTTPIAGETQASGMYVIQARGPNDTTPEVLVWYDKATASLGLGGMGQQTIDEEEQEPARWQTSDQRLSITPDVGAVLESFRPSLTRRKDKAPAVVKPKRQIKMMHS